MADRYVRRRAWAIALMGGKCVACGSKQDLEFDHIDPLQKSFPISKRLATMAQHRLIEELNKCQLLCKEHHAEKTRSDLSMLARMGH